MGKRKNRADRGTYERIFVGNLRAPKGRRWTKPSVVITALETVLLKNTEADAVTIAGLQGLRDFAATFLDRLHHRGKSRHGYRPNPKPSDKGNVYLEYAWAHFNMGGKRRRIMDENDVMAAVHNGGVNRWYDGLINKRPSLKPDKVMHATNPKRLRRAINKAKANADKPKVDPNKVTGDRIRADATAARKRQAEFTTQYRAEETLTEQFKAMLKGA